MSYFPTDRDILTSSLWVLGSPVQTKVWFYLMLSADPRTGIVSATVPAIAAGCVLPLEDTEKALEWLTQPDKYSRTKDHDGRRIEYLPDGRIHLLTYLQHKEKDYSTPRVQRFRDRETARNGETVDETVKRCETVSETTDTDTKTNTDTKTESIPDSSARSDEIDPHEFTQELVAEVQEHLPDSGVSMHPALSMAVSNLLTAGHPRGLACANGRLPLAPEDIRDAVHGWILAERGDSWHLEQRARGTPFTFSRLLTQAVERLPDYAEKGRAGWGKEPGQAFSIHGLEHARAPPVEVPVNPEITARHQAREAERIERVKAWREEKPPESMPAREKRKWWEEHKARRP